MTNTVDKNLDYKVAALLVLQENGVAPDIQDYLVNGSHSAVIPAGLLDRMIEAILKEHEKKIDWEKQELVCENQALRTSLDAFNTENEALIGYVSAEDIEASAEEDPYSTSTFISKEKNELYEYPIYRAPVTRNRMLSSVQAICDKIIKPNLEHKGDPDTDFWRAHAAREIRDEIEVYKEKEQFDFEKSEILLVRNGEEEVICVHNVLLPAFMAHQAIARKPKVMPDEEWRELAGIIIKALKRQV